MIRGISVVVPDFNISNYITSAEGLAHFKIVLVNTILVDYIYSNSIKKY